MRQHEFLTAGPAGGIRLHGHRALSGLPSTADNNGTRRRHSARRGAHGGHLAAGRLSREVGADLAVSQVGAWSGAVVGAAGVGAAAGVGCEAMDVEGAEEGPQLHH